MESLTANQTRDSYIRNCLDELYKLWLRRLLLITSILNAVFFPYDMLYSVEHLIPFMGTRFAVSLYLLLLWWVAGKRRESGLGFHRLIYFAFILGYMIPLEIRILMSGALASPYYSGVLFLILLAIGFIPERIYMLLLTAFTIQSIYLVPILLISGTSPTNIIIENNTRILFLISFLVFIRFLYSKRLLTEVGLRYDLMEHKGNLEELVNERTEELMRVNRDLEEEIHEKRKIEATLQKSENQYRTLAENVSDVIWTRNLDLKLTYISPSILKQQGYTVEEAMNLPLENLLTSESFLTATNTLEEQLAIESMDNKDINRTATIALEIIHKNGSIIPVELNMGFVRDSENRPVSILGVTRDVSDRKLAENALWASDEKYRLLFENMIYGYAHHRIELNEAGLPIDYTFLEVNKAFGDVLGMTRDQLIGKRVTEVLPGIEESEFDWIKVYGEVALTGESVNFEQFSEPLDKWFSINAFSPEKEYFSVIFEDITERKQAQNAILKSEQKYRSLFENASDAIYIIDSETQRIVDINKSASRTLGYSRGEFIGMSIDDIASVESISKNPARMAELKTKGSIVFEHVHVHKSGYDIPVEINTSIVMWEGIPVIMAFARDITKRKLAEEGLRRSEEKYRRLFDNTPLPVFLIDPETKEILDANNLAVEGYGYSRDELLNMSARDIRPQEEVAAFSEAMEATQTGSNTLKGFRHMRKDGSVFDVEVTSYNIMFQGKKANLAVIQDVTERLRIEEAIREREEKYAKLFEGANDAILLMKDDMFIDCNSRTLDMFGVSRDQIIGHAPYEFSPATQPDGRDSTEKALAKLKAAFAGKPQFFEWVHKRLDGTTFVVEVGLNTVELTSGTHLHAIVRDITERKQAEEALKASEEKFAKVFFSSPDSITVSTLKYGIFIDVNEGFLNMSGFSREEIIGKSSIGLELWPNPVIRTELADILKNKGRIRDFETEIRIKSGELRIILLSAEIIELNEKPHMVAIARDITERKIMESALLESETHLREFAEMLPEFVFETDHKGNFTFVNENASKITGYDRDELTGSRPFDFLIAPEERAKSLRDLEDTLSGKIQTGTEIVIISKAGNRVSIMVYSTPVIKGGKAVGTRGLAVDITNIRKAEEDRRELERKVLEASESERRRIGYDLHDGAGQLLTGTAFIAKVLEQQLKAKGMPEESQETSEIVGNINKAIDMIRRLSRGLYPIELETSGLYMAFKDLIDSAQSYYKIKCDLKFNKRIRITDKSVATQLYLIAREAVNNAAKHSRAESILVSFIKSGNTIRLEVLDDGEGIPVQLDESKGMGLQTMRYRAGLIGAALSIRSTPKGTRIKCEYKT